MDERRRRWLGWMQLFRVPNLLTVPGDPLAGAVLAATAAGHSVTARQAGSVALAALCLYMVGLALNDLHDLPGDRVHRPERPLPRGLVSVRAAWLAVALLAALGLGAAAGAGLAAALTAIALLGLVCLYNLGAKARAATACPVMGLCRGASMMLGAVAVGGPAAALLPAGALTVYIGAVTWLSRREDEPQRPGLPVLLPPLAIVGGCLAAWVPLAASGQRLPWSTAVGAGLATALALQTSLGLFRREVGPGPARAAVGRFIGLLLPWQAALLCLGGTPASLTGGLALLAAWPAARRLARRVSAS